MFSGGEAILSHYQAILAVLSAALSKESFPRALDNICGAVARLITANPTNVPLEQVWKLFVDADRSLIHLYIYLFIHIFFLFFLPVPPEGLYFH